MAHGEYAELIWLKQTVAKGDFYICTAILLNLVLMSREQYAQTTPSVQGHKPNRCVRCVQILAKRINRPMGLVPSSCVFFVFVELRVVCDSCFYFCCLHTTQNMMHLTPPNQRHIILLTLNENRTIQTALQTND